MRATGPSASTARVALPPARRACPYCGGALAGRHAAVEDWRFGAGGPADVYSCDGCGALAAGRVPEADEVASWYANYYTHSPEAPTNRSLRGVWPTPGRLRELDELRRYFTPPGTTGRFLEVGTGSGERLVEFADAGWDVVGQDLDLDAGRVAGGRGIRVHRGPVSDLVGSEEPFDLIGLSHVVEHAADPAALLEACASLLAPGGRLCVVSPNAQALGHALFGRWWFGLEQPRHLAIPTLRSLEAVTAGLGLTVLVARTSAANANVMLGRSLERPLQDRLRSPRLRAAGHAAAVVLGQAMGRAATLADHRLGEEVVWIGQRPPR